VVVAWLAVAGVSLLTANRDVRKGLNVVEGIRKRTNAAAIVNGSLLPDMRTARSHFSAAHARIGGPLLAPARILPFVGRQLQSVNAMAAAATTVSNVAITGMIDARPALADPGTTNLARAASARQLGQVAARADATLAHVSLGPRVGLMAPLAKARNRLGGQVGELRAALAKGAAGGAAVADLLQGPRRYLVFAANNSEMRAGSGMLLSAGELETGPDGVHLSAMQTVTDIPVPIGSVPLDGDLAARWGWLEPNVEWRNLLTSPRFDVAAPLAARMWVAAGHPPVDGVMVLDPVALAGFLRATGPIEVDGRRFVEDNIVQELLHDQYQRFPTDEDKPERREELGKIAGAIFTSLDGGSWSLPGLSSGLASAAGGRHLLMWAADPSEESAWHALGVDGSLQPDSLLLSVLNRGGNKLDQFLQIQSQIGVAAVGAETEVTMTVRFQNNEPVGEPFYITGPHPQSGIGEGVYQGILSLSLPAGAHDARFDGVDHLAVEGEDGPTQVIGFQFELPRGGTRTVVARFLLPGRRGTIQVEPSARVPPTSWRSGSTTWVDSSKKLLTWTV
jgi:hypothetical protein